MIRRRLLLAITLLAGVAGAAEAQFFEFGQNKIQYRRFDWRVLKGEHAWLEDGMVRAMGGTATPPHPSGQGDAGRP